MNEFTRILREEWKERPLSHKLIAIFGGIDTIFYIVTPLLLVLIWGRLNFQNQLSSWVFYTVGFLAASFRAYKIGWMTNE